MDDRVMTVVFGDTKYRVSRGRFAELIENTVKQALPENFIVNSFIMAKSTESIYVSVLSPENGFFYFRVSSHKHQKGRNFNNGDFATNDYRNFKELEVALNEYFLSDRYVKMTSMRRYLVLDIVVSITTKYRQINLTLLPEQSILRNMIEKLAVNELISIRGNLVAVTVQARNLLNNLKERYSHKVTKSEAEIILPELMYRDITQSRNTLKKTNLNVADTRYNIILATQNSTQYQWYIPNYLRGTIKKGHNVVVATKYGISTVTVDDLAMTNNGGRGFKPVIQNLSWKMI